MCSTALAVNCDGDMFKFGDGSVFVYSKDLAQTFQSMVALRLDFASIPWSKFRESFTDLKYYQITQVKPDRSCSGEESYYIDECTFNSRFTSCTTADDTLNSLQTADLFGAWETFMSVSYACVDRCYSLENSRLTHENWVICKDRANYAMALETEVSSDPKFVTNFADCYHGTQHEAGFNTISDKLMTTFYKCVCVAVGNEISIANKKYDYGAMRNENHGIFTVHEGKVTVCDTSLPCPRGQYQSCGKCDDQQCLRTCEECNDNEYSNGNQCKAKNSCPKNSSAVLPQPDDGYDTVCSCDNDFYIQRKDVTFQLLEENAAFEAHQATCQPCSGQSKCTEIGTVAKGCQKDKDDDCVCAAGYTDEAGTCVPCAENTYKKSSNSIVANVKDGVTSFARPNIDCAACPHDKMLAPQASTNISACKCAESWIQEVTANNKIICKTCFSVDQKKPYRAFDEPQCTDCKARHIFDHESQQCKRWEDNDMTMDIQCSPDSQSFTLNPRFDEFVRFSTQTTKEILNPNHDLWTRAYSNIDASKWSISNLFRKCSACKNNEYRLACGGPVRQSDDFANETYLIAVNINHTATLIELNSKFSNSRDFNTICSSASSSVHSGVSIRREGMCQQCIPCDNGEYVKGCDANQGGVCTTCEKCFLPEPALKHMQEYLDHPLKNQCNGSATQDCTRKKCPQSFTKTNIDDEKLYYIQIHCGVHDVTIWDPDTPRLQDTTILSKTYTGLGKYHAGEPIHYCPTGYYVDTDCFTENSAWNPACCKLCTTHDALKRRGAGYQECPGNRDSDTQKYVERCENGFFETEVDGERQCSQCETCSNL